MNDFWGKAHFGLSFLFMNAIFLPMFFQVSPGCRAACMTEG